MTLSDDELQRQVSDGQGAPSSATQWRDTIFIWIVVAVGGGGLWLSTADPIFGGPDLAPAALMMFAFFATMGVAATLMIWCWPAVWHRWFHLIPAEGNWRLEAAKMVSHGAIWIGAIVVVACMVTWKWRPVTVGAVAGCLMLGRLALDIGLQHWLGDGPLPPTSNGAEGTVRNDPGRD